MKNLGLILLLVVLLSGCTNNEVSSPEVNQDQKSIEIEKEIEKMKSENAFLKEKIENFSGDVQNLDHKSRNIIELLTEGKFDKVKTDFGTDVELTEDNIFVFTDHEEPSYINADLASLPMYFIYYNPQPNSFDIGYHVYGGEEGQEFKRTISFLYDLDFNLESIFSGE
ncbi:hypothetical protein [Sutcliffiella rhizosphaerae]|uniref:Lipoprotein n=1 Tax=Sutcliffiella rhizosphaerae TaxID=2880967 RepID=A0ABM8YK87_9BACI|nr:hypothetical protein [Sutcliffiella rhizosphaerae]CAG9620358.1 hypothetical protein BACCIP111883_01126 [Sutcliffiella rhizosphaerae]